MSTLTKNATKPLSVKIADTLVKTAVSTISTMYRAYHTKGGVAELEQKLEIKRNGLAQGIFELAVTAAKLGQGKQSWTTAYFKEICKAAEAGLKEELGNVENVKVALPCWPVFKSEINRAIDSELNPADFETYGALKAARMELSRKERESEEMRTGERAGGEQQSTTEGGNIAESMGAGTTKLTPKLAAVITVMQGAISGMEPDSQDEFADELAALIAKYGQRAQPAAQAQEEVKDGKAAVAA